MWDLIVSVPDHCLSFYFGCTRAPNAAYHVSRSSTFQFQRRRFLNVFGIYGHGSLPGHVTRAILKNFHLHIFRRLHVKFGFNRPSCYR